MLAQTVYTRPFPLPPPQTAWGPSSPGRLGRGKKQLVVHCECRDFSVAPVVMKFLVNKLSTKRTFIISWLCTVFACVKLYRKSYLVHCKFDYVIRLTIHSSIAQTHGGMVY